MRFFGVHGLSPSAFLSTRPTSPVTARDPVLSSAHSTRGLQDAAPCLLSPLHVRVSPTRCPQLTALPPALSLCCQRLPPPPTGSLVQKPCFLSVPLGAVAVGPLGTRGLRGSGPRSRSPEQPPSAGLCEEPNYFRKGFTSCPSQGSISSNYVKLRKHCWHEGEENQFFLSLSPVDLPPLFLSLANWPKRS